jgi:hypothetical protein
VPPGVRDTDLGVASHTRMVYRNVIAGLKATFDGFYDREPQLQNLRITQNYPLKKIDYPSIVVDYQPQRVVSAGVGHVEWFRSPTGYWRKWKHSRFEGTLSFHVHALSTLDRDIVSDAIVELVRFGSLDANLNRFYEIIYPDDEALEDEADASNTNYSYSLLDQLMLDSDQMIGVGNSATIAPWSPEDVLVYTGGWSCNLHGGYYNSYPTVDWGLLTKIKIQAYDGTGVGPPFLSADAEFSWSQDDEGVVVGRASISSDVNEQFVDAP